MNYEKKTKAQLIEELTVLRKRVEALENAPSTLKDTRNESKPTREKTGQPLSNIVESIPDAIYAIDAEGKVIIWHKGMEKLTGVKAEEMLGKGDHEYSLPFYGVRKPTLIDMVLKPDSPEIEKDFLFIRAIYRLDIKRKSWSTTGIRIASMCNGKLFWFYFNYFCWILFCYF